MTTPLYSFTATDLANDIYISVYFATEIISDTINIFNVTTS